MRMQEKIVHALSVAAVLSSCLFVPVPSALAVSVSSGTLIKGSGPAVYYYSANGTRLVFPNERTYLTWYSGFSGIAVISDAELAAIPIGGNVTYRPGARLVKVTTDPKVYAVSRGGVLRWVQTAEVASVLYGASWSHQVDDVPDTFFVNYSVGIPIAKSGDYSRDDESANAAIEPAAAGPGAVPVAADVTFTVDLNGPKRRISPFIYGLNQFPTTADGKNRLPGAGFYRQGGNRLTAYNWENNASNAGSDWGPNSSDGYMSDSATPGLAVTQFVDRARSLGATALVTVPIVDYVAADKDGVVTEVASGTSTRWVRNAPRKPAALSMTPDLADRTVYQDEFVHFIEQHYGASAGDGKGIFFALDNEPALWPSTHSLVHPDQTTYAEMADRTVKYATMIKEFAPAAKVFGAESYGFEEFVNLQQAPDQNGREYLDFILDSAKTAGDAAGHRVMDVLDLHWYPEATGGGVRISDSNAANPSRAEIEARVQAPRSLWDESYTEKSWIADYLGKPIALIPWVQGKIDARYPGTSMAFSEYYYGGAKHISGGIAEADVLGIFGRSGVYEAALWPIGAEADSFIYGAFDLFLNYDGSGHRVGDTSLVARTSDTVKTSVYAMAGTDGELDVVAINKTDRSIAVNANIAGAQKYSSAVAYQLTSASPKPARAGTPRIQGDTFTASLPAMSVTAFVLKP